MFCFSIYQYPSEKGSTLKGKHLLPPGANAFLLEKTLLQKGEEHKRTILTELSPLKVYQFPLICIG